MATQDKNFRVKNGIDAGGSVTANSIIKSGGTSSQYLMADGSVTTGTSSPASPTVEGILYGRTNQIFYGDTALGYLAGNGQIGGTTFDNTFIGAGAGSSFQTGSGNIFIGTNSGNGMGASPIPLTIGANNILIGQGSQPTSTSVSNEITIGNSSINRFRVPGLGIDWTPSNVPSPPQDIIPLDDLTNEFNGTSNRFVPKYQGSQVTISNPYRLLLTINGIIQYIDSPDYVWMSGISRRGFFVDNDGQLQFSEAVPAGSEFDARLMPGSVTTTRTRTYPFKALDILLGG